MKKLSILLILVSFLSFYLPGYAQKKNQVDLSNPNATIYTHIYFLMPDSYDVNKSAATIREIPREEARDKVRKLKEVLDGNGLRIDFSKVPKDPNFIDTLGIGKRSMDVNEHRYAPFPIRNQTAARRRPLFSVRSCEAGYLMQ